MCIFSSILNHRQANQKNSIIKGWQQVEILNVVFFFCHQKTIKNRQALHEIIRALSLSIIFVEFSFKPVYLTMVVKIFKFMENYNSWKMYLQVKILTLDIFTYMLGPLPLFPLSPCSWNSPTGSFITPQVTMIWSIRLFIFYVICNFFKCDDFTVL